MIYRALEVIQIFGADERTNEGVLRGPRGPKKVFISHVPRSTFLIFGWASKRENFFSLPYSLLLDYSIFELTTLPYPTRN